MIIACWISGKGFHINDYDTRLTNGGFSHEVASGHATAKRGYSVSAIHGTTNFMADHWDDRMEVYVAAFSQTTGTFPKFFVASNIIIVDMSYIENSALVVIIGYQSPANIEIHDTTQATGTTYSGTNRKTGATTGEMS
jgi:hypothetical protein